MLINSSLLQVANDGAIIQLPSGGRHDIQNNDTQHNVIMSETFFIVIMKVNKLNIVMPGCYKAEYCYAGCYQAEYCYVV